MRCANWLVLGPFTLVLCGCGGFGHVEQGRVVECDRTKGLLTVVLDSNAQPHGNPRYDRLPAAAVRVPSDPAEMGPAPQAGKLLAIDPDRRQIVTYDAGRLKTISYIPLEEARNIRAGDPRLRMRFPVLDRDKGTITLYEPHQRLLLTLSASGEQLALPEATWSAGDEIRYYYKKPGQAIRLMNITRTDLGKGDK